MRFVVLVAFLSYACAAAPPPPPARGGSVQVAPGLGLHYRIVGDGPDTVIVLHGGPGLQSTYLTTVLDPLAVGRALIYYDQRGRGQSDLVADTQALTAANDVEDLETLRRSFGASRVTLIAHHWGAVLAALYAKRYPQHVKRLVLVSPSFPQASYLFWAATLFKPGTETEQYLAALRAGADTTDPRRFCTQYWGFLFSPTPVIASDLVHDLAGEMCDAPPAALRASWRVNRLVPSSLHGLNLRDTLRALTAPVLVIQGMADSATMAAARAWTEWSPGARAVLLPGPGLFPWRGAERRFRKTVSDFLDAERTGSPR